MEGEVPAEGTGSQNAEAVVNEAPVTAQAVAEPKVQTTEPSTPSTKPDLAAILSDPEIRKELFKHPEIAREIDHRAASEAGRRAKAEIEKIQRQTERQKALAELDQIMEMDELDAGARAKQEAAAKKQELARQAQEEERQASLQPIQEQIQSAMFIQIGNELWNAAQEVAKETGIAENDERLNPQAYATVGEFFKGLAKIIGTEQAKREAKELAKIEAKAILEERNAAERDASPSPEVLPPAGSAQNDNEFAASYASGSSNDTARQIRWMRENGIV